MLKLAGELMEGQLAEHIARLDAHTRNFWGLYRTGAVYQSPAVLKVSDAYNSIAANTLYTHAFPIARDLTVDRIGLRIIAAGAAGSAVRLGIYKNGANLYPGALLLDAGTLAADSDGHKLIVINQALTRGLYWVCLISDSTPQIYYSGAPGTIIDLLGDDGYTTSTFIAWKVSQTYGSLPDPFPSGASKSSEARQVSLRLASLD